MSSSDFVFNICVWRFIRAHLNLTTISLQQLYINGQFWLDKRHSVGADILCDITGICVCLTGVLISHQIPLPLFWNLTGLRGKETHVMWYVMLCDVQLCSFLCSCVTDCKVQLEMKVRRARWLSLPCVLTTAGAVKNKWKRLRFHVFLITSNVSQQHLRHYFYWRRRINDWINESQCIFVLMGHDRWRWYL